MSKIEVTKMVFDTESGQPELLLSDGTTRVVMLMPTGNCWVEYWVTPEYKHNSEVADRERRDKELQDAVASTKVVKKKHWWSMS